MHDVDHADENGSVLPLHLTLVPGGSSISLTFADMLVGRHSEADVRLHLPDVSRRHCRFRFHDGNWYVHDLQSMNGVYVNDERVGQAEIHEADLIRIGGYTFQAHIGVSCQLSVVSGTAESLPVSSMGRPQRKAS